MQILDGESKSPSQEGTPRDEAEFFEQLLSDRPITPPPSPNSYKHPDIKQQVLDMDWTEEQETSLCKKQKDHLRKMEDRMTYVGISSKISDEQIKNTTKFYFMQGIWTALYF